MKTNIIYNDDKHEDIKEIQVFARTPEERKDMLQTFLIFGCLSDKLKVIILEAELPQPISRDQLCIKKKNTQGLRKITSYTHLDGYFHGKKFNYEQKRWEKRCLVPAPKERVILIK